MSDQPNRLPNGHFVKGYTPNPGGRHKKLAKVTKKLLAGVDDALAELKALMKDEDSRVRLGACQTWLKHSVPVPKETPEERKTAEQERKTLPPGLAKKLAALPLDS